MEQLDRQDVDAAVKGDHEAYARLVRRYEGRVARLMWRFSRDVGVCEQLVQDVFVEAYFSLKGYRGDAPLIHWLSRIGTRVGCRFWKAQARERTRLPLPERLVCGTEPSEQVSAREAADLLAALLAEVPVNDRLALTLVYFEQCSMKEVATLTGWNPATVKMRVFRARQKLKKIAVRERVLERLGWIS